MYELVAQTDGIMCLTYDFSTVEVLCRWQLVRLYFQRRQIAQPSFTSFDASGVARGEFGGFNPHIHIRIEAVFSQP